MASNRRRRFRSSFGRKQTTREEDLVSFFAAGELILGGFVVPMQLQALSYNGFLPEVVEITSQGFGDIALRRGIRDGIVELSVCGRQFTAHLSNYLQNCPVQWVRAADIFAALFPYPMPRTITPQIAPQTDLPESD